MIRFLVHEKEWQRLLYFIEIRYRDKPPRLHYNQSKGWVYIPASGNFAEEVEKYLSIKRG